MRHFFLCSSEPIEKLIMKYTEKIATGKVAGRLSSLPHYMINDLLIFRERLSGSISRYPGQGRQVG
jgi:hypothetical protein